MKEILKGIKLLIYTQNFMTNIGIALLYLIIGTIFGLRSEIRYCAMWYAFPWLPLLMDSSNLCAASLVQSSRLRRTILLKSSTVLFFLGMLIGMGMYFVMGGIAMHRRGVSVEAVREGVVIMLVFLPLLVIYNTLAYRSRIAAIIVLSGVCVAVVQLMGFGRDMWNIKMPAFFDSFPLFLLFCVGAIGLVAVFYMLLGMLTYRIPYSERATKGLFMPKR